ncbi:MAG: heterodisulfide reductase-related iron-sulfur binding cluster [Thermoanaerobaculaceae bacterium]|nr:heterodisulfide reductase-related iron-sulfur binding cluster [Thermoanaerobaculaceae bacterium]
MPDPTAATYLGIPGSVYLWGLAAVAFVLFGWRVYRILGVLARGRPEPRWDRLPRRLWSTLVTIAAERRMFDNPGIGLAHLVIFWAFVFYASTFAWSLLRGLLPFLPIPYPDEIPLVSVPMVLISMACLVALAGAAVRRYLRPPLRLSQSRDATIILALITLLVVTFLVGQAAKAGLGELSTSAAESLYVAMWWVHIVTVLVFLAYLPYSKHLHLLASPFNVLTAATASGGVPPPSEGAARLEEFTWRELLNGISCAECGRCDRACPAFAGGGVLSPQDLVHDVKLMVLGAASGRNGTSSLIDVVGADAIWACTTCGACMERCPVFNEHIPLIIQMRRHLIGQGEVGAGVQDMLMGMTRYGNSFGQSPRSRPKWTRDLEFEVKDARKEPVEYLWYVGDYASFDPRVQEVTRTTARVFNRAGLDFGILFDGEQNAGNDVRRLGEEGLSTDPHTYHVLKHEYGLDGRVRHYTEVIEDLISSGRLPIVRSGGARVTYHDPCYLGRYGGVYEAPRRVLASLGADLVEMPRNRSSAYCCGAGGGRIWMEDVAVGGERPAESRVREAAGLQGTGTMVVACPKDLVMFRDALKTTGLEGTLAVRDIAELVEEAMSGMQDAGGATLEAVGATQRSDL